MWKKLGAALMGAVLLGAAAGCTPTSTPSTSSSTSTTSVSSSGPREAYFPSDAIDGQSIGGQVFAGSPDLAIDSANYPVGTDLTARVQITGRPSGVPAGSPYGVCVSLQTLETGLPVGDEVCVTAFAAADPASSVIRLWPTPVVDPADTTGLRTTVTGMLRPGANKYVLRIRPADGFTCSSPCTLSAGARSLRASW